jgi:hypothetical protein
MENDAFKACPFCKEQIRKEAVKCRFCGEWLEQQSPSLPPQPQQTIVAGDLADIKIESL